MIAVRPPAYFPPLDYMALVQHVDRFVLADTLPYRRGSWHDRSKLREAQGAHWIEIPLFGQPDGASICDVDVETGGRWQEKHWRSFLYDYRTTMYFEFYKKTFRPFFEDPWTCLGNCTARSVELLAELFGLDTPLLRASSLPGRPDTVAGILEEVSAETLVVPETAGVAPGEVPVGVEGFAYDHPTYRQNFEGFEPGMTAADLVFNYGREAPRILSGGVETRALRP